MKPASRSNGKGPMSLGQRSRPWAMSSRIRRGGRAPGETPSVFGGRPSHSMRLLQRPRTLKDELQILFLAVGSAFLVLATVLLYQNGQASLRRQLVASASSAAETASALISLEDHRSVRAPADFNSRPFRNIVQSLGALRRANPDIVHLFTIAPIGDLGAWGVVVDMGGSAPVREEADLVRGRVLIGSRPPASLPAGLISAGMAGTTADILDLTNPSRARAAAVSPIGAPRG